MATRSLTTEELRDINGGMIAFGSHGSDLGGYIGHDYSAPGPDVETDFDAGISSPGVSATYDDEDDQIDVSVGVGVGSFTFSF